MNEAGLKTITLYLDVLADTLKRLSAAKIYEVVEILAEARDNGRRIYIFGNGGSAATASHFACDLNKGAISTGKNRLRAVALSDNVPLLSAWANDTDYRRVFCEQIENLVEPGDVAIAISGSGNSPSVLDGVTAAREKGARVIGLTGFEGGKLKDIVDVAVVVPSDNVEQIEDVHLALVHTITVASRQLQD